MRASARTRTWSGNRTRNLLAAGLVPLLVGALAACGSDDTSPSAAGSDVVSASGSPSAEVSASEAPTGDTAASEAPASDAPDSEGPAKGGDGGYTTKTLLPAMKAAVEDNRSTRMTMKVVGGRSAMDAEGVVSFDRKNPAMMMTMTGAALGTGQIEMRMVDGVMYMSMPPMTPQGKFVKIDLSDPDDPLTGMAGMAGQMGPQSTFAAFDAGLEKVRYVGEESVSGEDMDHYVLTVDVAKASKAQGQSAVPGTPPTVTYDLWLDAEDLMRKITFEMGSSGGMDMTMSQWGEPVSVKAPAANDIVKTPGR